MKNLTEITFINLQGWDVECLDGKYRSANMFCSTLELKKIAIDVIKKIQNGEDIQTVMYGNLIERLQTILDNDVSPNELTVCKDKTNSDSYSKETLFDNLNYKIYTKERIKEKIDKFVEKEFLNPRQIKYLTRAITKYLDEFSTVYSMDKIALELKQMKEKIVQFAKEKGIKEEEIIYIIPETNKSFGFITRMFAKINQIDPKNISGSIAGNYQDKKLKVVIDDLSISGMTQDRILSDAHYRKKKNTPVLYCTLLSCKDAYENENLNKSFDSILYMHNLKDLKTLKEIFQKNEDIETFGDETDILTPLDYQILELFAYFGWNSSGVSCAMPYMIPDNSSNIGALVLSEILFKNNPRSNKVLQYID